MMRPDATSQPPWHAAAIVLAGGKSRRMGEDKSLLPWNGLPLVQQAVETLAPLFGTVLLSTNAPEAHEFLGVPMVRDRYPDCGPIGGIASALEASAYDVNFVIACDIPVIPATLIADLERILGDLEAAVPLCDARYEPLFAWYRRSILKPMATAIRSGQLKLQDFLATRPVATLPVPTGTLYNLNTPEDLRRHQKEHGA